MSEQPKVQPRPLHMTPDQLVEAIESLALEQEITSKGIWLFEIARRVAQIAEVAAAKSKWEGPG